MPEKSRQTRKKVYDKRKFAAITIRIDNPKTTALLFSSGKLVVTGSVSEQMAMCAVRRIITELKSLALFRFLQLRQAHYSEYRVQRATAAFDD